MRWRDDPGLSGGGNVIRRFFISEHQRRRFEDGNKDEAEIRRCCVADFEWEEGAKKPSSARDLWKLEKARKLKGPEETASLEPSETSDLQNRNNEFVLF